jgi:hypothetical protein
MESIPAVWRKSTFSESNGCIEVSFVGAQVAIRDSKDRSGPVLTFSLTEWEAFLAGPRHSRVRGRSHTTPGSTPFPQIGAIVELAWRKSSRSGSNGCVEVAFHDGQIAVRDSKDRAGPVLQFTHWEWEAFLAGVRCGEFDAPVPLAQLETLDHIRTWLPTGQGASS